MVSSQILKKGGPAHFVPGVNMTAYLALSMVLCYSFSYSSVLPVKLFPKWFQLSSDALDSTPWKVTNFLVNLFEEKAEFLCQTFSQVTKAAHYQQTLHPPMKSRTCHGTSKPSLGWITGSAAPIAVTPHKTLRLEFMEPGAKEKTHQPWEPKITIAIVGLQKYSFYRGLGVLGNPLSFRNIKSYYFITLHALIQIQPFL